MRGEDLIISPSVENTSQPLSSAWLCCTGMIAEKKVMKVIKRSGDIGKRRNPPLTTAFSLWKCCDVATNRAQRKHLDEYPDVSFTLEKHPRIFNRF